MFIASEKRLKQLSDEAKKNTEDLEEAKKNSRFTQVSPKEQHRDHRQHARGDPARRKSMTERSERIDEEAEENRKPH